MYLFFKTTCYGSIEQQLMIPNQQNKITKQKNKMKHRPKHQFNNSPQRFNNLHNQMQSYENNQNDQNPSRCLIRWYGYIKLNTIIQRVNMEKYRTLQILGEGSFGTVFLIEDQKGKKYALKKVQVNPFKSEEALLQIEVMSKFIHPNVVRVYESSQSDNDQRIQILMQYCEGGDLLTYFKRKNRCLTVEEILNIFRQIVKAFIAMNVKDVLHRDLKPENVLLKNDYTVKIADFGCARMTNHDQISKVQNFSLDKGTPIYSSPEQLQNLPYSARCDVWSAGCLLYFISFGTHPFMDTSVPSSLKKIKQKTENKKFQVPKETDMSIKALLELALIYQDKERATWRQLWLSRFFCRRVDDVAGYISYVWSVCNIANWIVKQFWKARKSLEISPDKNEIFAYFTIKFQYTSILMASKIARRHPEYAYLFQPLAYKKFDPTKHQIVREIEDDLKPREKFFASIREKMEGKSSYKKIKQKQMRRQSCFSDLDNSIKATYRLLKEVLPKIQHPENDSRETLMNSGVMAGLSTTCSLEGSKDKLVWLMMAKWINFQFWFSYEKRPRIEDFLKEGNRNIPKEIDREMEKYRYGVVE